jgi:hypothetical protein
MENGTCEARICKLPVYKPATEYNASTFQGIIYRHRTDQPTLIYLTMSVTLLSDSFERRQATQCSQIFRFALSRRSRV